ncbi:unnamed protein product [Sphenostylis stenocarpa]|uniref:Uncharacterized protein n=1 Tax=Sphenostylis stenocarpa TaxID=92480 RepID=A0AA86SH91_9FABA|nr:unnamed protein product [Sphenostylis stenocarpa]
MINLQDLFVVDVEVDIEEDPEPKESAQFKSVEQRVAGGELAGATLRHGGWSGMEKEARRSEFERKKGRRRKRKWLLAWEGRGSENVVEFGSGRKKKSVMFAEEEGSGRREKCGLHFQDRNELLTRAWVPFFLRFNAMVDRDVMEQDDGPSV